MAEEKLNISWDDLRTRRVDNRLREQGAMERNRAYSQMQEDSLPKASAPAGSIWNNAIFCMTVFGLIGGLLAWGAEALVAGPLTPVVGSMLHYDPGAKEDCAKRLAEMRDAEAKLATGQLEAKDFQDMRDLLLANGGGNPYFRLETDEHLSELRAQFVKATAAMEKAERDSLSEKGQKKFEEAETLVRSLKGQVAAAEARKRADFARLEANDRFAAFLINLLSYGLCGMMIAMCLAGAEPITQRKTRAAWINCGAGAGVGLLGGVAAALLTDRLSSIADSVTKGQVGWVRELVMHSAAWGMLGLFLGLGSGLVLRSAKKIGVGIVGGLLGGLIGGALFNPVQNIAHDPRIGHLIALLAIGIVAGLATGLLENVVKSGWLKVTSGIIAGKQFILYRNPTYIGSSPDSQIYLFKDPQVGKRHAALHLLPTGIEIEDLPLGGPTRVNGKPVKRSKLMNGDTIEIGNTSFRFQEKRPK